MRKSQKFSFAACCALHIGENLCVLFFHQKKAFDDILTNKAPELLKDLDTFLGDKKWLVGNSVSIILVSPIPIRLPEK